MWYIWPVWSSFVWLRLVRQACSYFCIRVVLLVCILLFSVNTKSIEIILSQNSQSGRGRTNTNTHTSIYKHATLTGTVHLHKSYCFILIVLFDCICVSLQAVALCEWCARTDSHLGFSKDDIITVLEKQESWWYGELNESRGWFPSSFVSMVTTNNTQTE